MSAQESGSFERILDTQGVLVYRIEGVSMQPMLRQKRDIVAIRRKGADRLHKYDVALYRRASGKYVLHRIVEVLENGYIIRGDNCFADETDITDREVIGVLTSFRRRGREISVTQCGYRLYARFWVLSYPVRKALHTLKGFLTQGMWAYLRSRLLKK